MRILLELGRKADETLNEARAERSAQSFIRSLFTHVPASELVQLLTRYEDNYGNSKQ